MAEISRGVGQCVGSVFWGVEVGQSLPGQGQQDGDWMDARSFYTMGQAGGRGLPGAGAGQRGRVEQVPGEG
eukprot:8458159-Pyramimonas_sp.AAC.1